MRNQEKAARVMRRIRGRRTYRTFVARVNHFPPSVAVIWRRPNAYRSSFPPGIAFVHICRLHTFLHSILNFSPYLPGVLLHLCVRIKQPPTA
jgi:hypothetical protein